MRTSSLPRVLVWLVVCFGATACVREVKVAKIKCLDKASCPTGFICQINPGTGYGACIPEGSSVDGGSADLKPSGASDAPSEAGSNDVAKITGGALASGGVTASGGAIVAASGGVIVTASGGTTVIASGGVIVVDAGTPTGGALVADAGNDAPTSLANGSPCTTDSQCALGNCVDGVCCESKCDGQCQSCGETGSAGRCVTVTGDPRGRRTACSGTAPCKGKCDGKLANACVYPDNTTVCAAATCTAGTASTAAVCNSAGSCTTPTTAACPSGGCATDGSGKCLGSCTATSCGTGFYCATSGVCTKKADLGTACASKDECASGFCADGVCCGSACTGQCQACNATGTCGRVSAGSPRPGHTPCAGANTPCAGVCDGTADTCVYKGAETTCAEAVCANTTTLNNATVCNGAGACTAAAQTNCGTSNKYCNTTTNQCVAKIIDGGACTVAGQCTSANCSNSTCCATGFTGCSGTCINLSTSTANCGQCGRVCPAGQSCCAGTCLDLNNNNSNCGQCGRACSAQTCMSGLCCNLTDVNCGGACCGPNSTCSGSTCRCQGYAMSCGGCGAWNFETNTIEGWIKTPANLREAAACNAVQSFSVSTGRYVQGTHSMAVKVIASPVCTGSVTAAFAVPLCPATGAAVSLPANITLTAQLFFAPDPGISMPSFAILSAELYGPSDYRGSQDSTIGMAPPENRWVSFSATFDAAVTASHVGFFWLPNNWAGTIYVDQVKLNL